MASAINLAVAALAFAMSWLGLWLASHGAWWLAAMGTCVFVVANFALFALMHEAVHSTALAWARANAMFGVVCGWAFPQSFHLQRQAHMGHHRRNRTDDDLYDYYLPTQARWVRNLWLYGGNLLGGYYVGVIWGNLVYVLLHPIYRTRWFSQVYARHLGFDAYVRDLMNLPYGLVSLELLLAFAYQALVFWALDLNVPGYALAMVAFGLYWSALQYVIHAWSARDVLHGAWNLRGWRWLQWLHLNYTVHRVHHEQPQLPWFRLPAQVGVGELRPSFLRIYRTLWRHGVRPAPPMGSPADLAFVFPAQQQPSEQNANQ